MKSYLMLQQPTDGKFYLFWLYVTLFTIQIKWWLMQYQLQHYLLQLEENLGLSYLWLSRYIHVYINFFVYLLIKMQGENIDMDEALGKIQHNHPLILGFGSDLSHMVEFRVVIEKKNVITMPSLLVSIEYCLQAYYVFNIKYDVTSRPLCYLVEFLYGMTLSATAPLVIHPVIEGLMWFTTSIISFAYLSCYSHLSPFVNDYNFDTIIVS